MQNSIVPWAVRPYRKGDECQVVRLFQETFGKPMTEAHYRWKVVESLWPINAPNVWLAEAGGQIIGQYAGTPMCFKIGDKESRILHACDGMTAAGFRRQGVLTSLGSAAHRAWEEAGVPFVVGLPYGSWGSRRQYFRWQELFEIVWMWRPLRPERFLRNRWQPLAHLTPAVAGAGKLWNAVWDSRLRLAAQDIEVCAINRPGPEFDILWSNLKPQYEALIVRDRAWVAYRYVDAPELGYHLLVAKRDGDPVGYLSYRLTERGKRNTGWIADLFTAPKDISARAGLLHAALAALYDMGADEVRALVPMDTAVFSSFRHAGFLARPGSFKVSIVVLGDETSHHILNDANRWFTMGGDFDVI